MATYTKIGYRMSIKDGSKTKHLKTYTQPRLIHLAGQLYHRYHRALYPVFHIVDKVQMRRYDKRLDQEIMAGKYGLPLDGSEIFMPITNRQDATCFHLSELFVKNVSDEQIL